MDCAGITFDPQRFIFRLVGFQTPDRELFAVHQRKSNSRYHVPPVREDEESEFEVEEVQR